MRLGLLTYSTRPRGGVVHTLALAEALAALGERVSVIALGRGGDSSFFRPVHPSVEVEVVPFPEVAGESVGARVERSIEVLAASVRTERFDLVHAQDCISANAAPGSVRTVHHLDHFRTAELVQCHEQALLNPLAHVCVSRAVARELKAGWGIRATVIPNGVEAQRFAVAAGPSVAAAAARRRWQERISAPYVLSVGGIEPRKGSIDLVGAMATLRGPCPDVRLVIAGGETLFDYRDYRAAFASRCGDLDVEPVVLGPVAHDELPALVAGAQAFAFPSLKEGFGLAALEAAAAGRPLVVRDLPVMREVFAGAALFATDVPSLASALLTALTAPDPRRVDRGKVLAASYSWSAAAQAHRRLYEKLLQGG